MNSFIFIKFVNHELIIYKMTTDKDHWICPYLNREDTWKRRSYIGIDIDENYVEISKQRIENVEVYSSEVPNPKEKFIKRKSHTSHSTFQISNVKSYSAA